MVASLKAAGDKSYKVDADEPYAEMWIGTHPSGPSNLLTNSGNVGPLLKVVLSHAITHFPIIGEKIDARPRMRLNDTADFYITGIFLAASMNAEVCIRIEAA